MQFMHVGRIAHSANRYISDPPSRRRSSARPDRCGPTRSGCRSSTRRARSTRVGFPASSHSTAQATTNALAAGFDGVELHSASRLPVAIENTVRVASIEVMDVLR